MVHLKDDNSTGLIIKEYLEAVRIREPQEMVLGLIAGKLSSSVPKDTVGGEG